MAYIDGRERPRGAGKLVHCGGILRRSRDLVLTAPFFER
jgi:hypothetical protein